MKYEIIKDFMGRYWLKMIQDNGEYNEYFIYNSDWKGSPYIRFDNEDRMFLPSHIKKALKEYQIKEAESA